MEHILERVEASMADYINANIGSDITCYPGENNGSRTLPFAAVYAETADVIEPSMAGHRIVETYRARVLIAIVDDIDNSDPKAISRYTHSIKQAIQSMTNPGHLEDAKNSLAIYGVGEVKIRKINQEQSRGVLITLDPLACGYLEESAGVCEV